MGDDDVNGEHEGAAERLSRRTVYEGRRITMLVDHVRLPNGRERDFELVHHPGAAAMVPLLDNGDVVMLRQHRYATGGWLLEIPAGTLDGEEAPEACARRELREETGYAAASWQSLGWIWSTPGFSDERIWLYLATGLTAGAQQLESDEELTLRRLPLADAVAQALSGEIVDAKSVAALLRAASRRGIGPAAATAATALR